MSTETKHISYLEAIRQALADALENDPSVFLMGEDLEDPFGGAFKVTKGLSTRFPGRVINTPICEDAIAGAAVGAAIEGARPVIEIQFADFATIAFNQIVNNAGTTFWRTGHACPMVVRLPVGGTPGGGPFHCQMPEGWMSHHPGVIIVAPSTVQDAYGLMRDSIKCNDPVVFCEHKRLYNSLRDADFSPSTPTLPMGRAGVVRHGSDCTVVSYGACVQDCLIAADNLEAGQRLSIEVIDLRCLRPLDLDTILASLSRTGRLVVATEAWPFGGIAAEVVAQVAQDGFHLLDAPVHRVTSLDTPIPFAPSLWAAHRASPERIMATILETVGF
jgi:pyruvate dehydrogenase E1 component beta subunit/2-oxoisovalerate dehydrogenase E1 component beta subunit